MPIVDIELVVAANPVVGQGTARALADAIGQALGAPAARVWVRLHRLDAADYAENEVDNDVNALPVFVTILHARPPGGEARADEMQTLAVAVAAVLGRPQERVHVEYAAPGAGRIAFGGKLVQ